MNFNFSSKEKNVTALCRCFRHFSFHVAKCRYSLWGHLQLSIISVHIPKWRVFKEDDSLLTVMLTFVTDQMNFIIYVPISALP